MKVRFQRLAGYTSEDRKQAIKSGFKKFVFDGTPTLRDPMGILRGVSYVLWFRPLGWTIRFESLRGA